MLRYEKRNCVKSKTNFLFLYLSHKIVKLCHLPLIFLVLSLLNASQNVYQDNCSYQITNLSIKSSFSKIIHFNLNLLVTSQMMFKYPFDLEMF